MSGKQSTRRQLVTAACLAAALAILVSAIGLGQRFPTQRAIEALGILLIVVLFVYNKGAKRFWSAIRPFPFALVLFVLIFAQLAGSTRLLFPFTRFSMYSDPQATSQVLSYWATPQSGEVYRLDSTGSWPALNHGRFGSFERAVFQNADELDLLLESLATQEQERTGDPLCAVEARFAEVDLPDLSASLDEVENVLVKRLEIAESSC